MAKYPTFLRLVLLASGVSMLLAVTGVVMPAGWIDTGHRWVTGKPFPAMPVPFYLARMLSAFYMVTGGLMVLLSFDVRRYAPVIAYMAWAFIALSAIVMAVAVSVDLPLIWAAGDAFTAGPFGVIVLLLQWKIRRGEAGEPVGQA